MHVFIDVHVMLATDFLSLIMYHSRHGMGSVGFSALALYLGP